MEKQTIGFMGLGIMGQAMATNILQAGYNVIVYNRTSEKTAPLRKVGASAADTPQELAAKADVIITMVTGPEAIDGLLFSEQGAAASLNPDKVFINMSSVSPAYTRGLAERIAETGAVFIDCPVSGSKKPAEDATLVLLAGGPEDTVKALEPLLLTMGKKVVYCGTAGMGSSMKMTINLLLGTMLEGLAETLTFGNKAGLSTDLVLDTVLAGPLSCGLFQLKDPMFRQSEYPVQFPLKHMFKDLRFILETAYENGASIPTGHAVTQAFARALHQGYGDEDFAAVKKGLD